MKQFYSYHKVGNQILLFFSTWHGFPFKNLKIDWHRTYSNAIWEFTPIMRWETRIIWFAKLLPEKFPIVTVSSSSQNSYRNCIREFSLQQCI
jgi:hypothetical protein